MINSSTTALLSSAGLDDDFNITFERNQALITNVQQAQAAGDSEQQKTNTTLHDIRLQIDKIDQVSSQALKQTQKNSDVVVAVEERRKTEHEDVLALNKQAQAQLQAEATYPRRILRCVQGCFASLSNFSCCCCLKQCAVVALTTTAGLATGGLVFKTTAALIAGGCGGVVVGGIALCTYHCIRQCCCRSPQADEINS